jgi:HTH-type transcriptional regulator / antitoxin HipB
MYLMKDITLRSTEQLGMVVRLKRKERGLSQSALAELLGVERKWVLRLEAGNPKAEFALVMKALEVLGVRLLLRNEEKAGKSNRAQPSRLDEVFSRLQRRDK